jgi:hypothetical protein
LPCEDRKGNEGHCGGELRNVRACVFELKCLDAFEITAFVECGHQVLKEGLVGTRQ